jgi:putative cell wall-binding protein
VTTGGNFQFLGPEDGTYKLYFERSDVQMTSRTYWPGTHDEAAAGELVVSEGVVHDLGEITLEQGGLLSGNVFYGDQGGTLPASATVSIFKLGDDDTYELYFEGQTDSTGKLDAGIIDAGTYAVRARPSDIDSPFGSEWHTDARYFADRVDVVVGQGSTVQFQDIVLEERYFDTWRTAGPNRFETAVEISRELYPSENGVRPRPPVVYLVNAYNYPDALAAGPAAMSDGGSILPVAQDSAPESILAELEDLNPARIVVAGGVNAVSDAVIAQVGSRIPGAVISRIGEATRYETAAALVEDAFGSTGAAVAFIATGRNYPDALAAGAAAGRVGGPVILVEGAAGGVDAATVTLLQDLGIEDVYIAGGTAVVSTGIESGLQSLLGAGHVHRLAGADRFQTAAAINAEIFGDDAEVGFLASGFSFADALAGGPLAASYGAPLYLSVSDCMPDPTFYGLWDGQAQQVWLLGGEAVLSPAVEEFAEC